MSNPTIQRHYGITIVSDEPVTGVYSGNDAGWMWDDESFDPDYGCYCPHCGMELDKQQPAHCKVCGKTLEYSDWDYSEANMELYGGWTHDDVFPPLYTPDPTSEYAAIFRPNSNVIQVLHSQTIRYGRLASPCYPGQVDARIDDPEERTGECVQPYYALPSWAWSE